MGGAPLPGIVAAIPVLRPLAALRRLDLYWILPKVHLLLSMCVFWQRSARQVPWSLLLRRLHDVTLRWLSRPRIAPFLRSGLLVLLLLVHVLLELPTGCDRLYRVLLLRLQLLLDRCAHL